MPIYEYRCNTCGRSFSDLKGIADDSPGFCSFCDSVDTRKIMSRFSSKTSDGSGSACRPAGGG